MSYADFWQGFDNFAEKLVILWKVDSFWLMSMFIKVIDLSDFDLKKVPLW